MHDLRFLHCRTPELVPYRISFAFVQLASAAAAVEARGRIIVKFLALLSVAVFPYLFILSRLVEAPMLFRMGACISLISLIGIWCIYASFVKISSRKIRAAGIVLLIITDDVGD